MHCRWAANLRKAWMVESSWGPWMTPGSWKYGFTVARTSDRDFWSVGHEPRYPIHWYSAQRAWQAASKSTVLSRPRPACLFFCSYQEQCVLTGQYFSQSWNTMRIIWCDSHSSLPGHLVVVHQSSHREPLHQELGNPFRQTHSVIRPSSKNQYLKSIPSSRTNTV